MLQAVGDRERVAVAGLEIGGNPRIHGDYLYALAADRVDPFMARLFAESIPRGGAVLDGSAYVGYHALLAARQVGEHGRVMALEPNPESYRALRANVRRNGFENRVVALPLGIGAWSGILGLDNTVAGRSIDVIKLAIDRDGVGALRGMRRARELSPDARLFVECNPAALVDAGTSAEMLLEELRGYGFMARVIEEVHEELVPAGAWLDEVSGHVQLLCEPVSVRYRLARRVRPGGRSSRARISA